MLTEVVKISDPTRQELELTPCIETRGILLSRRRHTQAALEKEQNEHWKIVWKKRIAENLVKNEIWLLKKNIKDIGQKIKNLKDLAMLTQQPPTPTPKSDNL
nr:uncharacterized protein LOC128696018 [Cherax quadricarinatus]